MGLVCYKVPTASIADEISRNSEIKHIESLINEFGPDDTEVISDLKKALHGARENLESMNANKVNNITTAAHQQTTGFALNLCFLVALDCLLQNLIDPEARAEMVTLLFKGQE